MEGSSSKNESSAKNMAKAKAGNNEQIVQGFQDLRQQQRAIAGKLSELEMERKEHDLVIETLKEVDGGRKCFRMVGGVLVERTVGEVLPALKSNSEQINKLIEQLTKQLESKGKELNEYREKFNIRVRGDETNEEQRKENKSSTQSVLVASEKS